MKNITALAIVMMLLAMVAADKRCQNLADQCNLLKTTCSPAMLPISSCCNLTIFPLSIAPFNVYQINTNCTSVCGDPFAITHAYCNMDTDDGGWTVVQRNRAESEINFDRDWVEYVEGFGDLQTEFWYGLKKLYCLTKNGQWEMRVDYQVTDDGPSSFIHYTHFSVGNASDDYPLMV